MVFDRIDSAIFYVKDFLKEDTSDDEAIRRCFEFAGPFDHKTIIFDTKDWLIGRAIELVSNIRIIVDGVAIRQRDLTFDNIFRAGKFHINPVDPNGFPLAIEPAENISIIGKNGAKLIGPRINRTMFHPTQKTTQEMVGDYWGWRGLQICFSQVSNFEISGFSFLKQRSWAVSFDRSSFGYIHDLSFNSTVKNGDGINIRLGCHHIKIENITGITSDDMVAINSMTVGTVYPANQYVFPIDPGSYRIMEGEDIRKRDIFNIYVSKVYSKTVLYSHGVALLSRGGHRIYNVYISDIYDANPVSKSDRLAIVGSYKGYSSGYMPGDIHSIRLNNIVSNSAKWAIVLNDIVRDFRINKVIQNREDGEILYAVERDGISLD